MSETSRDPRKPDAAAAREWRRKTVYETTLSETILPDDEYVVVQEKDIREENGVIETTLEIWMDEGKMMMGENDATPGGGGGGDTATTLISPEPAAAAAYDADPPPLLVRNIRDTTGRRSPPSHTQGYNNIQLTETRSQNWDRSHSPCNLWIILTPSELYSSIFGLFLL